MRKKTDMNKDWICVPQWPSDAPKDLPRILSVVNNHPEGVLAQIRQATGYDGCTIWSGFRIGEFINPSILPLRTVEEVQMCMSPEKCIKFRMWMDIGLLCRVNECLIATDLIKDLANKTVLPEILKEFGGMTYISCRGCGWESSGYGLGKLLIEGWGNVEDCLQKWVLDQESNESIDERVEA
jgi:hypothetical protein